MRTPEQDRLLKDVLHEEGYALFREQVFSNARGELRRKRGRRRHKWLWAMAASVTVGLALYSLLRPSPTPRPAEAASFARVRTRALQPDQVVTTSRLMAEAVSTESQRGQLVLSSGRLEIIQTVTAGAGHETLSDGQLLDLFKGHPVALVAAGPDRKVLVFLSPEDQARFQGKDSLP